MRGYEIAGCILVLGLVVSPSGSALANGEEPVAFDGNTGAPDQRGAFEQGEIAGSKVEHVSRRQAAWDVDPSGALRWTKQLEVVPGINGVQPSLAIAYDSQGDDGLLGQGFSLQGLPAIVRMPGSDNGAQSGARPRGVRFDDHDNFAFAPGGWGTPVSPRDKLVQGAFGASTYHTAIESWDQFVPYGNCGVSTFAPCTWVAEDGAGNTYYYGAAADGRLWERDAGHDIEGKPVSGRGVVAWALTHYRDQHGNVYRVEYDSDEFMLYPIRIEYGCQMVVDPGPPASPPPPPPGLPPDQPIDFDPEIDVDAPFATTVELFGDLGPFVTGVQTPPTGGITIEIGGNEDPQLGGCPGARVVTFEYETRPDITSMPARYDRRLRNVTMYAEGRSVRRYGFEYEPSPSPRWGRSRLHRIHEIGSDLVTEDEPTTFGWSDGKPMDQEAQERRSWPLDTNERVLTLAGDIDGDGKEDIVRVSMGADRRRVSWALGQSESSEWGTAPLGPASSPITLAGSYREWSATIADVDADGRDDLLLWVLHDGQGSLEIHHGGPGGLLPLAAYGDNPRLGAFAAVGARESTDYRLLVADVNGDQMDDVVFVDRHPDDADRLAYALGDTTGLGALNVLGGAQLQVSGTPAWLEPTIADIDGDGIDDVIVSFSRITGITSQLFRGRPDGMVAAEVLAWAQAIDDAACPGSCFGPAQCSCNGVTPYQVLRTDINGDGIGDLTLAYTGAAVPMGNSQPMPFGRNVQTWLGQGDFAELPIDAAGRRVDGGKHQLLDPASYPGIDYATPNYAHWEHHSGDVNGDGFSDVVAVYAGVDGLRAGFAVGTPGGQLGPMTTITECAASSTDADFGDPCAPMPDGDVNVHRFHSLLLDFDGDDRSDLLLYYAGNQGRRVEIARGTTSGLGAFESLLADDPVFEAALPELDHQRSVSLLTPDLNGDGGPDLVLASQDEVVLLPTFPGAPGDVGRPDLLVHVDNGYGGTLDVEHQTAPRLTDAVDPDATECGNASGDDCGQPQRGARSLATRTIERDGLGGTHGTRYRYVNGRYYPGPVIVDAAGLRPHPRADLAFEIVEELDEQSNRTTRTHYYQDPDLKRLPSSVVVEAPLHPPTGPAFPMMVWRENFVYEKGPSPFNAQKIELGHKRTETLEWGMTASIVTHDYAYDFFGGMTSDNECADDHCIETVQEYFPPDITPGHYIVQRLRDRKIHVEGKENVISWERHAYSNDLLVTVDKLLCDDAAICGCFEDADDCTTAGIGRWVPVEHDRQYDGWGNLEARRDALGHQTRFEYDDTFHTYLTATVSEVEDATGVAQTRRTEKTYDDAGRVSTETDFNGNVTIQHHDALGRKEHRIHPNGREEFWDYENGGNPSSQLVRYRELVDVTDATERFEERYFDGLGRLYRMRHSAGAEVVVRQWREYFVDDHRIELRSDPHLESAMGSVLWTETIHDPRDRVIEVNRVADATVGGGGTFLGTLRRRTYGLDGFTEEENAAPIDDGGTILGEVWRPTTYASDDRGNTLGIDTPGVATTYFYDDALRLQMVWGPHAWNSMGPIMAETFVTYDYDTFGRVRIVNESEGWNALEYDDNGNLTLAEDASGEIVEWTHDEWGRVQSRESSDGTETYLYDQFVNGVGQLTTVSGPWGSEVLSGGFDAGGNPLARTLVLDGLPDPQTESYGYDAAGRVTTKTLPDGTTVVYDYDDAGQLRRVDVDGATYLELDQYDAFGNPGFRMTPASITTYEYNADHRLLDLRTEAEGLGEVVQHYAYSYDAVGNVLGIVDQRSDTKPGGVDMTDTWTFTYDSLDQLQTATDHHGTLHEFEYDAEANITRKGDFYYEYDAGNIDVHEGSLTGPLAVHAELDAMGRVQLKEDPTGTWDYVHDAHGRLVTVKLDGQPMAEHLYDASGRRVRKTEWASGETVTTWYVSPNYEVRASSTDPGAFVPTRVIDAMGHGVIAVVTRDRLGGAPTESDVIAMWGDPLAIGHVGGAPEGVYFQHHNHLGSTSLVTTAAGEPVSWYRNSPWGERLEGSAGFDVAFHEFTGQIRDENVALLYYGARYYDPALGRFAEPDSDEFGMPFYPTSVYDPRVLNRHVYVRNNPVRYTDPTGHEDAASGFVRRAEADLDRLDNEIVQWEGETMTMKEALRRIESRPTCQGLKCAKEFLQKKWKQWRGEDAEIDFSLDFSLSRGPLTAKNGKDLSLKGDNTTISENGVTYKPDVQIEAGPLTGSGSVTVTEDGNAKANATAGVGKSFANGKAALKAEATLDAATTGNGTVKVQPGARVTATVKPIDGVGLDGRLVIKDGSHEVPLPDTPDKRIVLGPLLRPILPNERMKQHDLP